MIHIVLGFVTEPGPIISSIAAVRLALHKNGFAWQFEHPNKVIGCSRGREWTYADLKSWFEAYQLLEGLTASLDRQLRYAIFRAVPRIPAGKVEARIDVIDGVAFASYTWNVKDAGVDLSYDWVPIVVNEKEHHFDGIAPYPIPGYDLAWVDDSPGG